MIPFLKNAITFVTYFSLGVVIGLLGIAALVWLLNSILPPY